jgi:Tfp pilus assembly protein PilN
MIKINLLESITDHPTGVAMVEDKVANPRMQTFLMGLTVGLLLVLGGGYDYVSSQSEYHAAERELENQRRISMLMQTVNKEQADLEQKTKDIQARIDAIQKLKTSQQGPSEVLREIKARFDGVPGLYLKSIEQKDGELTIKGESPNEASVTKFGQTLEFSSGLFGNFNIETQREVAQSPNKSNANTASDDPNVPKQEVVTFTVKCNYGQKPDSPPSGAQNPAVAANQAVKK